MQATHKSFASFGQCGAENQGLPQSYHERSLGSILVEQGRISSDQLYFALFKQRQTSKKHLGRILLEEGLLHDDHLAEAIAQQLGYPYIRLAQCHATTPLLEALAAVPKGLCARNKAIPIYLDYARAVVVMANPFDLVAVDDFRVATGVAVDIAVAGESDIMAAIERFYGYLNRGGKGQNI